MFFVWSYLEKVFLFHRGGIAAQIFHLVRSAVLKSFDDHVPKLAAALAYYTIFSLTPLVVISITVAGRLFGAAAARGEVSQELSGLIGAAPGGLVEATIQMAGHQRSGWLGATVSTAILLYGASVVFADLQESMDMIWKVEPRKGGAFWEVLRKHIIAILVALGMGMVLLMSLLVHTLLTAIDRRASDGPWLGRSMVAWTISFALTAVLFATVYKFLPDTKVPWRSAWIGALVTAALFTLGKFALTLCLRLGMAPTAYGALASLVAALAWLYYCAHILYFGAELCVIDSSRLTDRPASMRMASSI